MTGDDILIRCTPGEPCIEVTARQAAAADAWASGCVEHAEQLAAKAARIAAIHAEERQLREQR
jgi:hypothetical protein